jgi:exosortase
LIARLAVQAAALWAGGSVLIEVARASEAGLLQSIGLLLCLVIFARDRGAQVPDPRWLACSSLCVLAYAVSMIFLPKLVALLFALASLGALLAAHVRAPQRALGLLALACSAAPLTDVLQAVLGAPLRAAVSSAAAFLLRCSGLGVEASGVALVDGVRTVFVDPACSGLRYLWCAYLLAALLSAWLRLDMPRTIGLLLLSIPATFAANVLRATSLFMIERSSLTVAHSSWVHSGIGAAGFALVCVMLVLLAERSRRRQA